MPNAVTAISHEGHQLPGCERDCTGLVIAAALLGIGVERSVVMDEYLLSDGADPAWINLAIEGLAAFEYQGDCRRDFLRQGLCRSAVNADIKMPSALNQ